MYNIYIFKVDLSGLKSRKHILNDKIGVVHDANDLSDAIFFFIISFCFN